MRIPKWVWLSIPIALIHFALWAWWHYDTYCDCHCYGQQEYSERWGWTCKLIGEPASFLTVLGLIGVAIGFLFIKGQMAQSDDSIRLSELANQVASRAAEAAESANKLAQANLDTYMVGESGRFVFEHAVLVLEDDTYWVHFRFKNAGRSSIELRAYDSHVDLSPSDQHPERHPFANVPLVRCSIPEGGVLGYGEKVQYKVSDPINTYVKTSLELDWNKVKVAVQFYFRYATLFGWEYEVRFSVGLVPDDNGVIYGMDGLTETTKVNST